MRSTILVCYDICDARRLRLVFKTMRGWGEHLQYSVFRCELSPRQRAELIAEVDEIIDHNQDQVLLVDLGPSDGRANGCFLALGRPVAARESSFHRECSFLHPIP